MSRRCWKVLKLHLALILGLLTALSFKIVRPLIAPVSANEADAENEVLEALKEMVASVKQSEKATKKDLNFFAKR